MLLQKCMLKVKVRYIKMNDKCILNDLRDYLQDKIRCNSSTHCTAMSLLHLSCNYCMYFMSNETPTKAPTRHRCIYVNWKVK